MDRQIRRGDIYFADLNPVVGSEQGAYRPVLIVQNDIGNKHSPTVIIAPLTCNTKKNPIPTHVYLSKIGGLGRDSLVLTEQVRVIDRSRLDKYIGNAPKSVMSQVDKALSISMGL